MEQKWSQKWSRTTDAAADVDGRCARSIFETILKISWCESGVPGGAQGGPIYHRNQIYKGIEMYNSMFYTPSSAAADFGSVLGTLDPKKWSSRVGEVLFSRKSHFSSQIQFWNNLSLIFCGL